MSRFIKHSILLILWGAHSLGLAAQQLEIISIRQEQQEINLVYSLQSESLEDRFFVSLYSQIGETRAPVQNSSGDVGQDVAPGTEKVIVIPLEEVANDSLLVSFVLEAELFQPFVTISLEDQQVVRIGKSRIIYWEGGDPNRVVAIELYQNDEKVMHLANSQNSGYFDWTPSRKLETGKDYKVKISDINFPQNFSWSKPFEIKGPTFVPIGIAGAVATGVIAIILLNNGEEVDKIPTPPQTPEP